MKRSIKFTKYVNADKLSNYKKQKYFLVYLNEGYCIGFKNVKHCIWFLKFASDFVNSTIDELNFLSADIFRMQACYFKYFNFKDTNQLLNELSYFYKAINLALDRYQYQNGNYFVFQHLKNATQNLENLIKIIEEKLPSDQYAKTSLNLYKMKLLELKKKLNSFPEGNENIFNQVSKDYFIENLRLSK